MIDISSLLSHEETPSHAIRYASNCRNAVYGVSENRGPVVAWNITQRCNFKCKHCYSSAMANVNQKDLSLSPIKGIVDQMQELKVPVILLSGGEPMMHDAIFEMIAYIRSEGIRVSLSTNGSLITRDNALMLKVLGVSYVGISLDGLGEVNDYFRGVEGAYSAAVEGIRNCHAVGQKVGLRMTVHQDNIGEVPKILRFMEQEEIPRICFYHLVPSGRGECIQDQMLTHKQARHFMDDLLDYTLKLREQNIQKEILTVANHSDGPYTYLRAKEKVPALADSVLAKLQNNGGNRSGIAIMNMDWQGNVYPDQFSRFMPLGNVLEEPLKDIWLKGSYELERLRNKRMYLNRRCKQCRWLELCGGNLRARAYMTTGDLWAFDPGCYLKDDEI